MAYSDRTKKYAANLLVRGMSRSAVARAIGCSYYTIVRWCDSDPIITGILQAHEDELYERCIRELTNVAFTPTRITGANKVAALDRILRYAQPTKWDSVVRARHYVDERDIKRRKEEEEQALKAQQDYSPAKRQQLDMFMDRWVEDIAADAKAAAAEADNADDE